MSRALRRLLVEGRGDREVVYQFCNRHAIPNRTLFEVECMDEYGTSGIDALVDGLRVRPKSGEYAVLAAIFDADTEPQARWQRVRAALQSAGYDDAPGAPAVDGIILPARGSLPRVGLWMMPDNSSPGMLEDFLQSLVAAGDALLPRARQAVDAIPTGERRFKPSYETKAVVHTWLAWQEEPGTPLGLALTRQYLDAEQSAAIRFRDWLLAVFADGSVIDSDPAD
jgi:hypothetical protein